MALMAAHGEITPMPDCAIFADTQSEPNEVYFWLRFLTGCELREIAPGRVCAEPGAWSSGRLPFVTYIETRGSLEDDILTGHKRASWGRPPFFVVNDDGNPGMLRRQCTGDYKIDVIRRKVRALVWLTRRPSPATSVCTQWIGISTDEASRMKPSGELWRTNRWPLLDLGMSRTDCKKWLKTNGYAEPGKSACTFCPYRDDASWLHMKTHDRPSFDRACDVDAKIRTAMPGVTKSQSYVHRSLVPLAQVDFTTHVDTQMDMFQDECEGMCGV